MQARNRPLDRTRTFLTLVVLLHHAVIPYTHFGHTDPTSWIGFDVIATANDSFFMAMFFFVSGLFVWPSLARKKPLPYLRERLLRLGVPFTIGALTLIPLAYYAPALRQNPNLTFAAFWMKTVSAGPWPSGPIWFIAVLLLFDVTASLLSQLSPALVLPINRVSRRGPLAIWWLLVVVGEFAYVPLLLHYGASHWFEFGPFALQASRVLLYFSYFLIGAGAGSSGFATGALSAAGELPKRRWVWAGLTLMIFMLMWGMIYLKRVVLGAPPTLPLWYDFAYATLLVLFSASILLAIFAFFLNGKPEGPNLLDRMQSEAYGMFLVHYPIVLWIQYILFDVQWPAIAKVTIGFLVTVVLSWVLTAGLRKVPGVKRVL